MSRPYKCSKCKQVGHAANRCPGVAAVNGGGTVIAVPAQLGADVAKYLTEALSHAFAAGRRAGIEQENERIRKAMERGIR